MSIPRKPSIAIVWIDEELDVEAGIPACCINQ
jgi:hypothetical protein